MEHRGEPTKLPETLDKLIKLDGGEENSLYIYVKVKKFIKEISIFYKKIIIYIKYNIFEELL